MKKKRITLMCSMLFVSAAMVRAAVPDSLVLNQVVVTGTRTPKLLKDAPIHTRVINTADIERTDATDVQELLVQTLPGVEFSYAMSQQTHLNFSGFGGQSVLFLVDGERLAGETQDDVDFTRLNMANVERVEVVKGAASALYGSNASGGVINIITKTPKEPWTAKVHGRYGTHNDSRYGVTLGLNGGSVRNLLAFSATNVDSYGVRNGDKALAQTPFMVDTYYGGRTYNVSDKLTWQPRQNLRLTLRGGYFFRSKDTSTFGTPDHYRDLTLGARGVWDITPSQHVQLSYSFDQYDKAQHSSITDLCLRTYSNVQNATRLLYSNAMGQGTLTVGGDYMRDYLLNQKTSGGEYIQHTADVFAQYDYEFSEKWEAVGAVRYDYFSDGNESMVTPKINVRYKVQDNLTLRAGYGMGFRAPTLKEKYYIFNMVGIWDIVGGSIVGNTLRPEQSHNFTISADWVTKGYVLSAAAFYNKVHDRITTGAPRMKRDYPGDKDMLSTDKWLPYCNIKNYSTYGFDVTAQKRWENGLGARVAYAYVHEELPKDEDGEAINNQYQPARPHSLTVSADWDRQWHKNYGLDVVLSGRTVSAVDNIEFVDYTSIDPATGHLARKTVHYKAYTMWKLQVVQRLWQTAKLTFTVDNLFNYNPEYHYFNAPFTDGTSFLIGVSIDLR